MCKGVSGVMLPEVSGQESHRRKGAMIGQRRRREDMLHGLSSLKQTEHSFGSSVVHCWHSVHLLTNDGRVTSGTSDFQGSVASSPLVPPSSLCSLLPVRPSPGRSWQCGWAGVLGRREFPLESAAARICREAGGQVSVDVRVADLDLLPPGRIDNRKTDGLPLFHGAQLAVDATLVSQIRGDGSARRQCADHDGAALQQARHKKESTYPELAGRVWWCWVAKSVGDGPTRLEIS